MSTPLVSIQCLVYNHEQYLRQCLDGFVMQKTNFAFEAIVHDDASTDGSANIIREYAEKYPDIIKPLYETENQYSKKDGSLRRIINAAFAPSSKYIALCEGDDYWTDPYKLQKQVDFLEAHGDVSLVFTRCHVLLKDEFIDDEYPNFKGINDCFFNSEQIYSKWIIPTASVLYRRELYKYYNDARIYAGDIVLNLSMAEQGDVYGMSDYTTVYRINENGLTLSRKNNSLEMWENYVGHIHFLRENFKSVPQKCYSRELLNVYTNIFSIKYNEGKYDFNILKQIFLISPVKAVELGLGKIIIKVFRLNKDGIIRSSYRSLRYKS